jgi:hypothetical protein
MWDDFSKQEIAVILATIIVVCAVSAWGSIYVIQKYLIGERDDPLARAGGLKPGQIIEAK